MMGKIDQDTDPSGFFPPRIMSLVMMGLAPYTHIARQLETIGDMFVRLTVSDTLLPCCPPDFVFFRFGEKEQRRCSLHEFGLRYRVPLAVTASPETGERHLDAATGLHRRSG